MFPLLVKDLQLSVRNITFTDFFLAHARTASTFTLAVHVIGACGVESSGLRGNSAGLHDSFMTVQEPRVLLSHKLEYYIIAAVMKNFMYKCTFLVAVSAEGFLAL